VRAKFEQASDRVQMWMAEDMDITREVDGKRVLPGQALPAELGNTGKEMYRLFTVWAIENGGHGMTKGKLLQRLQAIPGVMDVRLGSRGAGGRGFNVRERDDDDPRSASSADSAISGKTSGQDQRNGSLLRGRPRGVSSQAPELR
jgi:hypothetical protein